MFRFRVWIVVFISGALIAVASATAVSAGTFTVQENRAWSALLRVPIANQLAKQFGKSNAVASMRWVCYELDSGATWDDISDDWIEVAMESRTVREQKRWLAYGAGVSVSAVVQMCPWHRNAAGLR